MKSKLIVLTTALLLLLSACELTPTPDPSTGSGQAPAEEPAAEVEAPEVVETEPTPEETQAPTEEEPEPTQTKKPVDEQEEVINCVELLEPLDGSEFPGNARVTFSWSAHPDAESYSLNFIFPDGLELSFALDETTTARYMSGFSMHPSYNQSGEHQWNVSALNAAGEALCQSDFFTFTKAISEIAPEESAPQDNGNGDSGNGVPPPPDDDTGNEG